MDLCGAKTRSREGGTCRKGAGWGTDHLGAGRCRIHAGRPVKHGRYSTITRPRIAELLARQADELEDPKDLLPEVRLLRALILDYVERHDALTEAILSWHESWRTSAEVAKPRQVPDILAVGKFIGDIGGLVDKLLKAKQEGSLSMATLARVTDQMGADLTQAAREVIEDADLRQRLLDAVDRRWLDIQV